MRVDVQRHAPGRISHGIYCAERNKFYLFLSCGEEIKPRTECTYLGTKIDKSGHNTTVIKHRIRQTRKSINILNSLWWPKNITKNGKLYIYQTIIQNILQCDAEVWQIPTREINTRKVLSTEWMC